MNSCLQNEENARAVENAIRTAVNTVMDVIYNMNSTKILEYERKVAERDKENETLKCKLKKAEDELTAFRVGLSFEFSALSPGRDFGKPMCNENEVASENDWRMDFPSLNAGTPGLSAERTRGQSPSASPVTSPVIKEEPADTGSFYIKWEMSEESIAEQQEGLGPMHVLGKESDGTSSVAGSQSPGDRRSELSEETSTERVKRRLSSAETQRQYRERIRADPEKLRAYKERAKCREDDDDDDEDWISNFHVPWQQTPESLRRAIAEGRRVEAADRRLMVRITVDAMRVHCLNPNKKVCSEIAKAIVSEYPESFADLSKEGELLSRRYSSLLTQIKTRVEHVNRNTENRIRRPKTNKKGENSNRQVKTARTKVDSYGCINWHPQDLPEGETPDSLENKRQIMATIFNSASPSGVDRGDVDEFMRLTYINQRHMINAWPAPSIGDVKEQWPFLFAKRWLCAHFHMLTGVEIDRCLSDALRSKGKTIVNFFRSQKPNWRRGIQSLLNDIEGDVSGNLTACAAILLVLSHFREKEDSLFLLADVNDTQMDVEAQLHLPATPRLIMLGSSLLASSKWMVSIEGRVVCVLENQSDFAAALSVLFGCFYVFNTEYQDTASATLELIQRFLVGINPNEGTKCSSYLDSEAGVSRRTGRVVQRKTDAVAAFLKDLTEFEWYYQKRVLISDLPEETQRQQREAWREASRRRRARKMSSLQTNPTQPCHPPQNTDTWGD